MNSLLLNGIGILNCASNILHEHKRISNIANILFISHLISLSVYLHSSDSTFNHHTFSLDSGKPKTNCKPQIANRSRDKRNEREKRYPLPLIVIRKTKYAFINV